MPKISNYIFSKHIEKCKISLEAFEEREVPDLKDDFKEEAEKILYEANNFLNLIIKNMILSATITLFVLMIIIYMAAILI